MIFLSATARTATSYILYSVTTGTEREEIESMIREVCEPWRRASSIDPDKYLARLVKGLMSYVDRFLKSDPTTLREFWARLVGIIYYIQNIILDFPDEEQTILRFNEAIISWPQLSGSSIELGQAIGEGFREKLPTSQIYTYLEPLASQLAGGYPRALRSILEDQLLRINNDETDISEVGWFYISHWQCLIHHLEGLTRN